MVSGQSTFACSRSSCHRLNRGRLYHGQGNYEQAIVDYTRGIAHCVNYDSAYCSRGLSYRQLGAKEQTIADFTTGYNATQDQGDGAN